MYDIKKDRIERLRVQFEEEAAKRSPDIQRVGDEYLNALTDFIRTYDEGPAGDPHTVSRIDTTGQLSQIEDQAAWAEQERHRVRRMMGGIT